MALSAVCLVCDLSEFIHNVTIVTGLELEEIQSKTEDLSCLPTLKVSDIERTSQTIELSTVYAGRCD